MATRAEAWQGERAGHGFGINPKGFLLSGILARIFGAERALPYCRPVFESCLFLKPYVLALVD